MDAEAISNAIRASVQGPKPRPSSEGEGETAPPVETQSVPQDTVSLSALGKRVAGLAGSSETGTKPQASGSQVTHQRKFDFTDSNELVLKIIDRRTQQVVRQIPAEELIRLRQAIQNGIENLNIPEATGS